MGRVDNSQGKMREVLGGGPAGLNDGWADRLGYGQSEPHGGQHIEEGVSYVAAGTAGKAWSVAGGSSLSLGPSLGQDEIILGSGPRGLRVAGAAAGRIIESRDDYGREQAQLLACWSVNSVRVLGQGAMGRATAGAPGQRAWSFLLFGLREKRDERLPAMHGVAGQSFRRPPSHRWRKG